MRVFSHQVPGGMLSNLYSQLDQQKAMDRMHEVLEEIPKVRAEVGYPPLVTPLSQIVGTQAVINVLTGKRWAVIPGEMKDYVKGLYGHPPGSIAPEIEKKILNGEERFNGRPAELLDETYKKYAVEIDDLAKSEEDVLSYALFPKETRAYLELHAEDAEKAVFMSSAEVKAVKEEGYMDVNQIRELIKLVEQSEVNEVTVEEGGVKIVVRKGEPLAVELAGKGSSIVQEKKPEEKEEHPDHWKKIAAPMVGTFYHAPSPGAPPFVKVGDEIEPGQTVCVLEAMKLMNEITADERGVIKAILVENAHPVEYGQAIFLYEPVG
ncbi:MAG: acetyl-CoA carboxylase biotin carboxyl carrier protein, partial [Candidatus Subteraquimicrobiales bacterium]|nr:acetyl-CoA carboxylase biotin carboxyl carrier protein [Candidatus Subteraquimicrobiales bacterium]